ncbi:hypothetical protein SCALM49S_04439 [Streptomyces californicus]
MNAITTMPATVELFDGTVTLTDWALTELSPDFYGHSYMQIGGWLPEGYQPGLISQGTNHMVRADLPGIADVAQAVNVTVETKGYGGSRRFMKIHWRHRSAPAELGEMLGCSAMGCRFPESGPRRPRSGAGSGTVAAGCACSARTPPRSAPRSSPALTPGPGERRRSATGLSSCSPTSRTTPAPGGRPGARSRCTRTSATRRADAAEEPGAT